ncbi:hypothetical protein ACHQM5_013715 [Ranunculus cassubicifolius]
MLLLSMWNHEFACSSCDDTELQIHPVSVDLFNGDNKVEKLNEDEVGERNVGEILWDWILEKSFTKRKMD